MCGKLSGSRPPLPFPCFGICFVVGRGMGKVWVPEGRPPGSCGNADGWIKWMEAMSRTCAAYGVTVRHGRIVIWIGKYLSTVLTNRSRLARGVVTVRRLVKICS